MKLKKAVARAKGIRNDFYSADFFVYQMGKVGSSSIENSLNNCLHFHSLYGNSPCYVHQDQKRNSIYKEIGYSFADYLKRDSIKKKECVKIITLVREPVGRAMSMFFQDLPYWLYKYVGDHNSDTRGEGLELLYEAFWNSYDHDYFNSWFDKELSRFIGFDVLNRAFPKEKGFDVFSCGKFEVLIATAEVTGNQSFIDELGHFVGFPVELIDVNRGENKWYGDVYKKFKTEASFTDEWLDQMLLGKVTKHFYSDEFIDGLNRKYRSV